MESEGDRCSSGESCNPDVVCEKHLFKSELSESLVQLACSHHHCAFPLHQNELCIWNTATPLHLSGHLYSISAVSFGSKINPLLVCSASRERVIVWNLDECTEKVQEGLTPQGTVIGTLLGTVLHVRFSPDDQQVVVCAGSRIYMLSDDIQDILAEMDGHLAPVTAAEFCTWEKNMLISVSEDRTFKVWDYSTGQLIYQSGVLTAFPLLSLLIDEENKQIITGCAEGQLWIFSLISDHNYRCIAHINLKKEQEKFCNKVWKSGKEIGNTVLLECCLWYILVFFSFFFFNRYSALNTSYFWIGSSTGLFIINLANFELEAFLSYKDYSNLSIRFARSCALTRKVLCLITSMFEGMIALLEVNVAALVRTQQSDFLLCGNENSLLVIASLTVYPNLKSTVKDQALVFHYKIKSSGYTATLFFIGDGEMLACGLADKTVLIFNSNLTDTCNVFSGHDGAVNSVGWSHDKKWLVSASEDRTLRVWSVCNNEPALILGREKFHKTVRFAQFYFIDAFILLCCGAEFHLLSFHLDTTKDDLKRYKQRSVCKLVQKFPMASTMEITSLSAVNDFYSYIVLTAGSNRALEVFDLNAGCSTAVIPEAHTRSVHQICQNKGSSFSTQQPEAYNLFMTTAAGDGIKLWDLRTLRCERRFEGHSSRSYPCGISVSPCGRFIATGSDDKCAYIYEMRSSTFSHKLGGHTESVINVAFSPSTPQVSHCFFSSL
uniref:WD repeat domain 27 n=1 Tax=Aquila chrysaetos chrysaetos TaxID=223781 RepID=A0A663E7M9_AQUCH